MKSDNPSEYEYIGTLKAFELMSGMTEVDYWGISQENNSICDSTQGAGDCGPSPGGASCKGEYGLNNDVFNLKGGGASYGDKIFFLDIANVAVNRDVCYSCERAAFTLSQIGDGIDIKEGEEGMVDDFYANNEWFAIEIEMDRGSVDQSDGYMIFYIYDSQGNMTSEILFENIDKMKYFDHLYNKFVFGGNRLCSTYGACDPDEDDRYYIDDFIIDNNQIAPTYFSLLSSFSDSTSPAAPSGLLVM